MIENDVGGGFGARGEFYPEDFLIPFAARQVNRPVKWIEDRREHLMAISHAREDECDLEVACASDGTILGHARRGLHRHRRLCAHQRRGRRPQRPPVHVGAVSRADVKIDSSLWMTNKTPVGTYRGPGRFEACFFLERMIDMRRAISASTASNSAAAICSRATEHAVSDRHVLPSDAKDEYDSGDYLETLDRA